MVPRVGLQFVIVVFPDHTHLLFELSLKVICEKFTLAICAFCNSFRDYEWTYICKLFKNILLVFKPRAMGR